MGGLRMSHPNVVESLSALELFADFDSERLERLVDRGEICQVDSNVVLFHEGDEGDILYLILDGHVSVVTRQDPDKVYTLGAGDVIGEIALLDGLPRTATVKTNVACQLFRLSRENLEAFLEVEPAFAFGLMKVMNKKIRASLGRERQLNASLKSANQELERLNLTLESLVEKKTEQLRKAIEDLRSMVERDPLTGVYNRRKFDELLENLIAQQNRMSLIMLDVDHFKRLNDTHGHQAGDRVLMQVAAVSEEVLADNQYLARYGGEEFGIILEGVELDKALEIAESIRNSIQSHHFSVRDIPPGHVCASLGVATFPGQAQDVPSLIEAADKALYRAKENGRNRVEVAEV